MLQVWTDQIWWIYVDKDLFTKLTINAGAHFMNDFSIEIQIQWKFNSTLIQVVVKWLLWDFAHGMTAYLQWHVQNFIAL